MSIVAYLARRNGRVNVTADNNIKASVDHPVLDLPLNLSQTLPMLDASSWSHFRVVTNTFCFLRIIEVYGLLV